jgi:dihydrofolate reductase/nitroimidazol reductase NimA-like FMN-containing flavoprotein (pyridoxamine 5'-phosphate oxidase superfamily)
MGAVLWHVTMSADGFIAGPGDAMEWVAEWPGPNPVVDDVIASTGALVIGRRTYEVEDRVRGGFYGGAWTGPYFVLTHAPPATVPDWMTGAFVGDGIAAAIERARAAAGERDVVVLGADIARQCMEHGLLDEILVHLAPVLLGDGVRLFDVAGGRRANLETVAVSRAGQVTNLRFRVAKGAAAGSGAPAVASGPAEVARAIIDAGRYLTLATADEHGRPWASPVWYAHTGHREFLWVSDPGARHSRNIAARPEVGIVIFDSRAPVGRGQGVYVSAVAEEVADADLEPRIDVFARRSVAQGAPEWTAADVRPPARLRLYRAVAREHHLGGRDDTRTRVGL